jgi:hypothetical protein
MAHWWRRYWQIGLILSQIGLIPEINNEDVRHHRQNLVASNAEQVSTAVVHSWNVQVPGRRNDCTGHGFPQSQDVNAGFLGDSGDRCCSVGRYPVLTVLPTFRKILCF